MENPQFDTLLQQYYEGGDLTRKDRLRLAGRMGGTLLNTVIREGQLETLQLLLVGLLQGGIEPPHSVASSGRAPVPLRLAEQIGLPLAI